jgi:ABC-2 type transport system ATP-binding protein
MADHAILIRNLSKRFPGSSKTLPGSLEVLRDINLSVAPGTIVGLLGPNGAGKTTLLEILATLLLPTTGSAYIFGRDVRLDGAAVRQCVGYCPTGFDSFYPTLSATANLEFFAALNGFSRVAGRDRVAALFDLLGVNGSRHLDFQRHSTGMKQKLVLARALLADAALLLLDEPTKSLDRVARREVWDLLRHTLSGKFGKTILLVTHSAVEARSICDRIVAFENGTIVEATHDVESLGFLQA